MTAAENNCHPKTATSMVLGGLEEPMQKSLLGQPSYIGCFPGRVVDQSSEDYQKAQVSFRATQKADGHILIQE